MPVNPLMPSQDVAANPLMPQADAPAIPTPLTPTRMIAPDGKMYDVPPTSFQIGIKNGWRPISPEETELENKIEAAEAEKEAHPWKTAGNQFADEATLGIKPLIESHNRTDEENEIEEKAEERYVKKNPIKSYAAKGAGFLAPLAIPGVGEAGEAAEALIRGTAEAGEAALTRKVVASAAKYATEGALYSSPQAAVQAAYGDPEKAAETMLWGIGLSGVLGAGSELLGSAVSSAGGKLSEAVDTFGQRLNERDATGMTHLDQISRNVLGISDKQAQKRGAAQLSKDIEIADREGILSADPEKRPSMIKSLLKDSGDKIGEHHSALQTLMDTDPEIAKLGPVPSETASKFEQEANTKFPEIVMETHADQLKVMQKIANDIRAGGDSPSFSALQEIRNGIQKGKNAFDKKSPQAAIFRLADNIIQQDLEASAQRLFTSGELPDQMPDYLNQKARYSTGKFLDNQENPFKGKGKLSAPLHSVFGLPNLFAISESIAHPAFAPVVAAKWAVNQFAKNKFGLLGKSVSYLRAALNNPDSQGIIGGLMAKEGMLALKSHIDNMPYYLSGSKLIARSANPVQHFLDTNGLSKDQQYKKLTDMIQQAAIDTGITAQKIGGVAGTFTGTNLTLASLVAQKKLGALQWLQSQIPKNPNPPKAFQTNEWKPSKQQQQEFLNKVEIATNPTVVFQHFQEGNLTKADRDTIKAVYPSIYGDIVNKLVAIAYDPKSPKLDHDKRVQLSLFTGLPLDESIKNISSIQTAIAAPTAAAPAQKQAKPQRASKSPKFKKSPSLMTETQRLQFPRNK